MESLIVPELGCVYKLSTEGDLLYSPLKRGTNQPAWAEFDFVDHMSLWDEEPWVIEKVNEAEQKLREL